MSFECANAVTVTGSRADVMQFRADAIRPLSGLERRKLGKEFVEFSFEKLFRMHKITGESPDLPGDGPEYDYFVETDPVHRWRGYARLWYSIVIKNYEIRDLLQPLSAMYPQLAFVNAQVDEGSELVSAFIRCGRMTTWIPSHRSYEALWRKAAKKAGIAKFSDEVYDDDLIRMDVDNALYDAGREHWDAKVLSFLQRLLPAARPRTR
jgi:hypothetical protein